MKTPDLSPNGVSSPANLLHGQHRWMRTALPLAIVNAGLILTLVFLWLSHPSGQRIEKWGWLPLWWMLGIFVSALIAVALWALRHRSMLHSARSLDKRLNAMNRLETAVAYKDADDAVLRAQREETAHFLEQAPVRSHRAILRVLGIVAAAALAAHLATLTLWSWPGARTAVPMTKPEPPPEVPKASITWKSPAAETKAVPIEEVPLNALADSVTGLRDMVLEIEVNGEPKMSLPFPVEKLNEPGRHPVQTSIYLDQLNVEPFDMVSYYLHAKRISKIKFPEVVSTVQFVEIKRFRDDVREVPGGNGKSVFPLITALKVAQLRLMKENFLLAHAEISTTQPVWVKENKRVGDEQGILEKKSGEVIAKLTQEGLPAEIIDLLAQAQPLMADASGKILAKQNQTALPLQGKSLGLITEIEKFMIKKVAKDGKSKGGPTVKDPFQKQQELELKQRFKTQAGEMELLLREQQRLAGDLNKEQQQSPAKSQQANSPAPDAKDSGKDSKSSDSGVNPSKSGAQPSGGDTQPSGSDTQSSDGSAKPSDGDAKTPDRNKIEGTLAERQTQISQRIGALLTGQVFVPEITQHLEAARDQARESLKQLDADDVPKAREPAASAAHELMLAKQVMDRVGEEKTKNDLEAALQDLNKAADQAANAPKQKSDEEAKDEAKKAADQVEKTRDDLAGSAKGQQEAGSEKAAARLAQIVNALNDPKLRADLQKLYNLPRDAGQAQAVSQKISRITEQIAKMQAGGPKTPAELAELVERVERSRANLQRLAMAEKAGGNQTGPRGDGLKMPAGNGDSSKPGANPGTSPGANPGTKPGEKAGSKPDGAGSQAGSNPGENPGAGSKPDKGQGTGPGQGQGAQPEASSGTSPGKEPGSNPGQEQGKGEGEGAGSNSQAQVQNSKGQEPGKGDPQKGEQGSQGEGEGSGGSGVTSASSNPAPASSQQDGKEQDSKTPPSGGGGAGNEAAGNGGGSARLTREVVEDLEQETREMTAVLGPSHETEELERTFKHPTSRQFSQVVATYEQINGPLDTVIALLKAELQKTRRQHELLDQSAEKALPAYRDAVADYFEQLSRDYPDATPPAQPDDSKKDGAQ